VREIISLSFPVSGDLTSGQFRWCNFRWRHIRSSMRTVSLPVATHCSPTNLTWVVFYTTAVWPGNVSCLQKFQHFWMIIHDLFFESGSTEATKIKKNTAKVCHLYFWSNNSALFEHWNWKSLFKHRWMVCFRSKKGVKNLFFLHEFLKLCQIFSHYLMK
jgi:hypothetical protein